MCDWDYHNHMNILYVQLNGVYSQTSCAVKCEYHVFAVLQLVLAQMCCVHSCWERFCQIKAILRREKSLPAFLCVIKPYTSLS